MEDQDSYHGDCDTYHVCRIYYDESGTGGTDNLSRSLGIPYSVFLFWRKDNQGNGRSCGGSIKKLGIFG